MDDLELEKQLLIVKIKTFGFWRVLFLGMAVQIGLITLQIGMTPLVLQGIIWLMIALGSHQYTNHLKDKYLALMDKEKKDGTR